MNGIVGAILAGGKGTRMDVLCKLRPKPALPFAGRLRIIDFSLSNSINSQIIDISVFVDFQRDYLINYLGQWQNLNIQRGGLDIREPRNGSYAGTADAIYQHLEYFQRHPADRILIMAGDHVYKMDYRRMLKFHEHRHADVTVAVVPVPVSEASQFGTVVVDNEMRILNFVEKSDTPPSNLASMGIYIFNKDILKKRLIEDASESSSRHDFGYAILPKMVNYDRVYAYRFDDFWRDVGTVDSYYATGMEFIYGKSPFNLLNNTWPILTVDDNLEPLKKFPRSSIENSVISPGCVIKGRVENSILSPGVWVDENAVVRNSILMSKTFVGYHSVVESCIIDEEVNIGNYCFIGFGNNNVKASDYSILGMGATIPSHTAVTRGCRVLPFSRVAASVSRLTNNYQQDEIEDIPALA